MIFELFFAIILILAGLYLIIREILLWRERRIEERSCVKVEYDALMRRKGVRFDDADHPSTEMMRRRIEREKYWASEIAFDCPRDGVRRTIDGCFHEGGCSDYFYRTDADGSCAGVMYCTLNRRELKTGDRVQ